MTVAPCAAKWAIWIEAMSWTIGRLLKWTTDYLREHGADEPRLDAEVLLAHARGCQRIDLYTAFEDGASDALRNEFRQLVKRRAEGTPVAYLVGYREFYSRRFRVTPDVLIPRPETEFVLVTLLDLIKEAGQQHQPLRLVDVGTGSGNLAIIAALELPKAEITAVDVSEAALQVARENARQHQVEHRIRFLQSDLLAAIDPDGTVRLHRIANPPYIGLREKQQLPRDVVDHEPHLALFSGEIGLDCSTRLIAEAEHRLTPGRLAAERNQSLSARRGAGRSSHRTRTCSVRRSENDLARRPRVLCAQRRP